MKSHFRMQDLKNYIGMETRSTDKLRFQVRWNVDLVPFSNSSKPLFLKTSPFSAPGDHLSWFVVFMEPKKGIKIKIKIKSKQNKTIYKFIMIYFFFFFDRLNFFFFFF